MKTKFKSAFHKKAFTEFIAEKIRNPYISRYEFVAAVFLLSANKLLWKRSRSVLTSHSIDFRKIDISGISTEGYALFKAAKAIYFDEQEISFNELCDCELIGDAVLMTIFTGALICRNGIDVLNWRMT